ncbi:MAG: YdcF family protein [Oscillospiraceae bacterium]|nr:YdcF family protein [Oscillospiraceae bacterium]
MKRLFKLIKGIIVLVLILGVLVAGGAFVVNAYVKEVASPHILTPEAAAELEGVDCILVLGCLVHSDGEPSDMLHDRLQRGVELHKAGAAPKLLMSGDHGQDDYDEVAAMKQFAITEGIASEDIFMDHAGFSTYESIIRARDVFQAKKIIIVTQEYHLYRALYLAQKLGVEAYGVASDYRSYSGQGGREMREILARVKDFAFSYLEPEPTYGGEAIPISGNGDLTNDGKVEFVY